LVEVGGAIVIEQQVFLPYPQIRLLVIDIKEEGEVGWQNVVLVSAHGLVHGLLCLPLALVLADIPAPPFGMEPGKVSASVQLRPRSLRFIFEDVGK